MKPRLFARMSRLFRPLRLNQRGNVLVLTAMSMPILIGGAGFGVDTVQWYLWKRELQMAVDAGALAGAYSQSQGKPYEARARTALAGNLNVVALTTPAVVTLRNWGGGNSNAIAVQAQTSRALPFSSMFLSTPPTFTATAVAAVISDGEHCMVSLEENETEAIKISGHALVNLGCGIVSNSRSKTAITIEGSARVEASPLSAVGGIEANDANLEGDTTIRPYAVKQKNPMAGLTTPPDGLPQTYDKNKAVLEYGVYNGLEIKANHTMKPGVYTINGGTLSVNSNNSLIGEGVIIVLKNGAKIDINGGSTIRLTAPDATGAMAMGLSPQYAGILIYEDAASAGSTSITSTINGNTELHLGGTIYMPTQTMKITGNADPSSDCLLLISKKIEVDGSAAIQNSCPPGHDYPGDIGAKVVRLVD